MDKELTLDQLKEEHPDLVEQLQAEVKPVVEEVKEDNSLMEEVKELKEKVEKLEKPKPSTQQKAPYVSTPHCKTLVEMVQSQGGVETVNKISEEIKSGNYDWDTYSVKDAWEAFYGRTSWKNPPCSQLLREDAAANITTSLHTRLTGNVLIQRVQAAYNEHPGILDSLVVKSPSNETTFSSDGIRYRNDIADVAEEGTYPRTTNRDRAVKGPTFAKRGEFFQITDETIILDKTGQILRDSVHIGRQMAQDREERGLLRIQDDATLPSFFPVQNDATAATGGTQQDVYLLSGDTIVASDWWRSGANSVNVSQFESYLDLNSSWQVLNEQLDDAGNALRILPDTLVVPPSLRMNAFRITQSTTTEFGSRGSPGVVTTTTPLAALDGVPSVLTSPFITDQTVLYGEGKAGQWVEHIIIPMEIRQGVPIPTQDINTVMIVRRWSDIFAVDNKFWSKIIVGS